ncbi:PAS domain S-box protein [Candidatus Bipolaricaulota bacterium]|nr:PAS domain S-box protein [Candidatus Bipolaricaulota bacterium]
MKKYISVLALSYIILALAVLTLEISSVTIIGILGAMPLLTMGVFYVIEKFSFKSSRELKGWGAQKYAKKLFNNSSNILYLVNKEGNIMQANKASQEIIGGVEKTNLHIAEVVHPEDLEKVKNQMDRMFKVNRIRGVDVRLVEETPDGASYPRTIPTTMRGTKVTEQAGILEFINNKQVKKLMKRLREAGARYRYLIEDAIDTLDSGVTLIDKNGEIVWANKTMEEFFNLNRSELIGLSATRAMSYFVDSFSNSSEFEEVATDAYEENKKVNSLTCHVTNSYGRTVRILEYRSIPIETERYRGGRIEHYIDVTEVKRLEEDLKKKKDRLEKSNEKLEEFSRSISHDLKAPLQTLEGYSQVLKEDYADVVDEGGMRALNALGESTQRLRSRIDSLLTYSSIKMDVNSFKLVDLNKIISELREDLKYTLQGVKLSIPEDLPEVYGNKTLLSKLFSNLITNAIKYNDEGTPAIEIGYKQQGNKYLVWLEDNGIGIKDRYLEKIFNVFEKLNPRDNPEGTGIGLAVCKRIVEEHKGNIWAESELAEGTTFYFTLPAKQEGARESSSGERKKDGINFQGVTG